jgi:hypothetical protein
MESGRHSPPTPQQVLPPAPPQVIPAARGDPNGDENDAAAGGSSSHNTELSEEQEPKGWIARPITRDTARGCHFHDTLDTLLFRAFNRHTWSIKCHCVVYQHRHWCVVRTMISGVQRPSQSIILSLRGILPRQPYKMLHDVCFRSTARCSAG